MVFNRLLGNGWSDLNDFFGRPPCNFDSNKMGRGGEGGGKSAINTKFSKFCIIMQICKILHMCNICILLNLAYFGPDLLRFFLAHFSPFSASTSHVQARDHSATGPNGIPGFFENPDPGFLKNLISGFLKAIEWLFSKAFNPFQRPWKLVLRLSIAVGGSKVAFKTFNITAIN